jgi:hypothetical protein
VSCPAFTVNVIPSFDLTVQVKLKPNGSSCGTGNALPSANVRVTNVDGVLIGEKTTNSSGVASFTGIKRNKDLNVCVSPASSECESYALDTPCTAGSDGTGCALVSPPAVPTATKTITYEFSLSSGEGWVTAIDGNVEADRLGDKIVCAGNPAELNPGMGFKPYLVNFEDDSDTELKAYIFSNNSSGNTIPTDSILETVGRGGWAFKLIGSYDYLTSLTYKTPGSWFKNVTKLDGSTSSTHGMYKISATDFNKLTTSSSPYIYSLKCE